MKATKLVLVPLLCLLLPTAQYAQSDELALKSQRAKKFMAEGKFAEAIPLYRELNQAVPHNPGLLLNLGMALHMTGDERSAIPQLEAAVKLEPNLAPAWLFLGAARLQTGKSLPAIEALRNVLRLEPGQPEALEMLAGELLSLDRPAQAAEHYRKLLDLQPENSAAWYGLGRSYESLSVQAFEALQKAAPDSAYWLALAAEARLREQQFSSSFYLYRRALEKMPALRGLHGKVSEIYRQTGHADWAATEQDKERQIPEPDCRAEPLECEFRAGQYRELVASQHAAHSAESFYWRSRAYNELALQAFAKLGQLGPSAELHELKAYLLDGKKEYAQAALEWREALKLAPANKVFQKQLAISLKFNQEYLQALPLFEDLLRRQPASAELNYLAGETYVDLQRAEEGIPLLQRAVALDPKLLPAHKALARADLAAGKKAEAIPHLLAALPTDGDGSLHYQLASAYQATGQNSLAQQALAEYREIQKASAEAKEAANKEVEITQP
jgi:tetratricopeptide (TPR) repeat protein